MHLVDRICIPNKNLSNSHLIDHICIHNKKILNSHLVDHIYTTPNKKLLSSFPIQGRRFFV
jgi:hypothetical protein